MIDFLTWFEIALALVGVSLASYALGYFKGKDENE